MRLTDFWGRMERLFGTSYASTVAHDQVLAELGGRTVAEALAAGDDAKSVWLAVCTQYEVPARDR